MLQSYVFLIYICFRFCFQFLFCANVLVCIGYGEATPKIGKKNILFWLKIIFLKQKYLSNVQTDHLIAAQLIQYHFKQQFWLLTFKGPLLCKINFSMFSNNMCL